MKVYLSSYRVGDQFNALRRELGDGAKVTVISNALDYIPAAKRARYRGFNMTSFLRGSGLEAEDLDLRSFFGTHDALKRTLSETRLIWAVGGNSFILRRAFRQSGLDEIIIERVAAGTLIYGGWSAGAVVAGSSLRGIHVMDDPPRAPEGYDPEIIWDGLGLVDFVVVPHFRSLHPETFGASAAVSWLKNAGLPFHAIRDGEVIVR
jgi:dipeptidase E